MSVVFVPGCAGLAWTPASTAIPEVILPGSMFSVGSFPVHIGLTSIMLFDSISNYVCIFNRTMCCHFSCVAGRVFLRGRRNVLHLLSNDWSIQPFTAIMASDKGFETPTFRMYVSQSPSENKENLPLET